MQTLGPILQFLGNEQHTWGVSLLLITAAGDPPPTLQLDAPAVAGPPISSALPGHPGTAWRFDIAVAQGDAAAEIHYRCNNASHRFHVPARHHAPSLGYVSCNGFSDLRVKKSLKAPQALWSRLARLHEQTDRVDTTAFGPLHLLLMGGDQVYSDDLWTALPELLAWTELPWPQRIRAPFTASMRSALQTHYTRLYLDHWSQPEQAAVLASVPTVMMWDDHDIIDGWGSHPVELHDCEVFQGIFATAKAAFELFQRQMLGARPPATLPEQLHHNSAYRFGATGLLVLDMRSERRPRRGDVDATGGLLHAEQVMSEQSWRAVYHWLDQHATGAGGMKHLYVMSSIPVVHPSFELLEKMLGIFPGQQSLEDDLRDHWTSPPHKAERLRLIHRLLKASENGTRVTILSGDVHVAAVGVIESDRTDIRDNARVINQLTASGVVHPPPPGVALYFLEQACKQVETIDRGITGAMYEFPTTSHRMIGCRNMMTLQPDAPGKGDRIWVNWWAEGEPHPYTKVIHAVG